MFSGSEPTMIRALKYGIVTGETTVGYCCAGTYSTSSPTVGWLMVRMLPGIENDSPCVCSDRLNAGPGGVGFSVIAP